MSFHKRKFESVVPAIVDQQKDLLYRRVSIKQTTGNVHKGAIGIITHVFSTLEDVTQSYFIVDFTQSRFRFKSEELIDQTNLLPRFSE